MQRNMQRVCMQWVGVGVFVGRGGTLQCDVHTNPVRIHRYLS
jgi:hypothetical protein